MKGKIKKYYNSGLWTLTMVKNAVIKGKLTKEDFLEITGIEYS